MGIMADSRAQDGAALEAVARHFSAGRKALAPRAGGACLELDARRIALEIATIRAKIIARAPLKAPRLRLDRVALRLMRDLQAALRESVPAHQTLIITITAPIRMASRTVAALVEEIGRPLARRHARLDMSGTIHENQIQARLVNDICGRASKVITFVHNPDSDPEVLFDVAEILLRTIGSAVARAVPKGAPKARWLVIADETGLAHAATYRQVCGQLAIPTGFEKILLVSAGGRVETLAG